MALIENIGRADFEGAVVARGGIVLVDFWAPWCGPCKAMMPVLQDFAEDREGAIAVVKVNVEENAPLAARFRVSALPTLLLFKDGVELARSQGAKSYGALQAFIDGATAPA